MLKHSRSSPFWVALTMFMMAPGVAAQPPTTGPDVAELARQVRLGHTLQAGEVLGQRKRAQPMDRLDALADSLVRIAVSAPSDGGVGQRAGSAAISVLAWAGRGETGVAYPGAAERLLIIAETAQDVGRRSAALNGLQIQPNRGQALEYLRRVAVSPDNFASYRAVGFLARDTGPAGLAVLRQLHRQGLVTHPLARRELEAVARYHGWP